MALDIGASPHGNWSGCHAVGWDRNAPEFGDLAVGDQFEKHSYPLGIMLNADGARFVDEGADFHSFTYVKDGRCAVGIEPVKSHWANPIDQPPFEAYATTCGITFTFGGLRVDMDAQVLDTGGAKIAGLYAAGEMVGGLFYFNYPSGTGLVSGAVFGRIAGASAAKGA